MKHINFTCDLCDRAIAPGSGTGLLRSIDRATLSRAALEYEEATKHICNNCVVEVGKLAEASNAALSRPAAEPLLIKENSYV